MSPPEDADRGGVVDRDPTGPPVTDRRWRRPGLLSSAVALGLVALLSLTAPDLQTPPRQWSAVSVGERGTLRDKSVTVTSVRTTSALELRTQVLSSTGVFVVAGAEVDALVTPIYFRRIRLETRGGLRYDPRSEWIEAQPPLLQPGFTVTGSWVFEVPADRVAGARLLVENEPREFDGFDEGLRIDLALDGGPPRPSALRLDPASIRVTR
ncbi:hypothetical protein GCM10022204_31110 [Microlunatus aurantiacus]|uniref:DUF4352 domain-containing protein n=1 Tax=Microlunatus aurantiacus TaxID=446786 RepID=A0ABP7DUQ5_9ACTN